MFGLGKNDDEQRFWNLIILKIFATDKEIEEMAPFLIIVLIIILAIVIGAYIFS